MPPGLSRNIDGPDALSCHLVQPSGDIMIRRFIGIVALAATVALPVVAQAQGKASELPARSAPSSAALLVAWLVVSMAFSASMIVRAFAVMWSNSIVRPINMARTSG